MLEYLNQLSKNHSAAEQCRCKAFSQKNPSQQASNRRPTTGSNYRFFNVKPALLEQTHFTQLKIKQFSKKVRNSKLPMRVTLTQRFETLSIQDEKGDV